MSDYTSVCVCGRPMLQLGVACGQNCKFDGRRVDKTIEELRTAITTITEKVTRGIAALSTDDTLECSGADISNHEKRAAAEVKKIKEKAETARMEAMVQAARDLQKISLQADKDEADALQKASQYSKMAREKALWRVSRRSYLVSEVWE